MTSFLTRATRSTRIILISIMLILMLGACGRLDSIPYDPPQTPQSWLTIQPFAEFKLGGQSVFFMQPSTTFWVYLLGLLTIGLGLHFLRNRASQRSRLWWGIAMVLWGLGALLAGTSYEAFSYAIKCAGREFCVWTSWWEVLYLIVTVWSFDAIFIATAYTSCRGGWRKALIGASAVCALLYLGLALAGSNIPVKFWISFELLILVASPGILIFFFINLVRYLRHKNHFDLVMIGTWLGLGLTTAAYFIFYASGIEHKLWAQGTWFTANDVLHIMLLAWMAYIYRVVAPHVGDLPENA